MKFLIKLLIFSALIISCNQKKNTTLKLKEKVAIKYAKGFDIQYFKNFKKLIIKTPYQNSKESFSYLLFNKKIEDTIDAELPKIKTPLQKIVATSTTHIPMLELLGVENTLIGFPHTDYVSSKKTRIRIDSGFVKEIGIKSSLNTEILLNINPDAIIGFSLNKTNKSLNLVAQSGIPVILNGDWLEDTPLGRAEWIKFFGVLYDKEKEADSIFTIIENNYLKAKTIVENTKEKPSILSGAIMSKDIWNLPAGESFVAQFLKDANTNYLWQNSKGKGSLSLSFESVFDKGKTADIWIAPGYFTSKKSMLQNNDKYKSFNAFLEDQIYTFANKKGKTGGVIYFELAPARPDLVLKDIIKITHPELMNDYEFTFFEKMK